jgi:hypothetical protein
MERKKVESTVALCQCDGTKFKVKRQTRTTVILECENCGSISSFKGSVAPVPVDEIELISAISNRAIRPMPIALKPDEEEIDHDGEGRAPTLLERGFRTLRFRVDNDQFAVVERAMEAVRVLNISDEQYRQQTWQGAALEAIAADFLSGVDPKVLEIVDAMAERVEKAKADYSGKNEGRELPRRRITAIASETRDKMATDLGLLKPIEAPPPIVSEEEAASHREYEEQGRRKLLDAEADIRIQDCGRLRECILEALVERSDAIVAAGGDRPKYYVGGGNQYTECLRHWAERGGHLFEITGDKRTTDEAGGLPILYLWALDLESMPDLDLAYDVAYENVISDTELTVSELVRKGKSGSGYTDLVREVDNSVLDASDVVPSNLGGR